MLVGGLDGFELTKWDIVNPHVTWINDDSAIVHVLLDGSRDVQQAAARVDDARIDGVGEALGQMAGDSSPADRPGEALTRGQPPRRLSALSLFRPTEYR